MPFERHIFLRLFFTTFVKNTNSYHPESNTMELKDLALFDGLTPQEYQTLIDSVPHAFKTFKAEEFIAHQSETVNKLYILVQGEIITYMTNEFGKEIVMEHKKEMILAAPAFLFSTENKYPVSVKCITDSTFLVLNKQTVSLWMHQYPAVMENFIRIVSDRANLLAHKVKSFALLDLRQKLIHYLANNTTFHTQEVIAESFGVARPSLNKALRQVEKEGIIALNHGKITLIDHEKLQRYKRDLDQLAW